MATPEGKVKEAVKRRMAKYSNIYVHMPVLNGMGKPSLDFIITVNGFTVAVETKAPGKKPTPRQLETMAQMEAAGARTLVVDGPDGVDTLELVCLFLGARKQ